MSEILEPVIAPLRMAVSGTGKTAGRAAQAPEAAQPSHSTPPPAPNQEGEEDQQSPE
jgi:hypothetical protein